MAGVRAMLARVRRIEEFRAPALSPLEAAPGGLDGWEAECRAVIEAGYLDRRDVPAVMLAVNRWHRDGCFAR